MDAPRVLSPIPGDFIAQVKVAGNISHKGTTTSGRFGAYHGAGLLAWQDPRTYLRFERAAVVNGNGQAIHYANLEMRRDAKVISSVGMRIPDQDAYLRLERRGGRIFALVGTDGYRWTSFEPLASSFPEDLKLGCAAINTSTDPLKAVFSELEVFQNLAKRANP